MDQMVGESVKSSTAESTAPALGPAPEPESLLLPGATQVTGALDSHKAFISEALSPTATTVPQKNTNTSSIAHDLRMVPAPEEVSSNDSGDEDTPTHPRPRASTSRLFRTASMAAVATRTQPAKRISSTGIGTNARRIPPKMSNERKRWDIFERIRGEAPEALELTDFKMILSPNHRRSLNLTEEAHSHGNDTENVSETARQFEEDLGAAFNIMDADGDGEVTLGEFNDWWTTTEADIAASKYIKHGTAKWNSSASASQRVLHRIVYETSSNIGGSLGLPARLVDEGFEGFLPSVDYFFDGPLEDTLEPYQSHSETGQGDAAKAIDTPRREMDETRRQLEDLQIKTISGLVEDITIEIDGHAAENKLLYLSAHQADRFDMSSLSKVLTAMDIADPKLVITFAHSGFDDKNARSAAHLEHPSSSIVADRTHSETDERELLKTVRRIEDFLQDVVLPIAVQTKAIVISDNTNCQLSMAFSKACLNFAKSHGGTLPFCNITITSTGNIKAASCDPTTVACKLRTASVRRDGWNAKHSIKLSETKQDRRCLWSLEDVPAGCSHYLIVEGEPMRHSDLQASFVQNLTLDRPSVLVATLDASLELCSQYLSRDLPVFLLDSRPPPRDGGMYGKYATSLEDMETDMMKLLEQLVVSGSVDKYAASQFAHLNEVLKKIESDDTRFQHALLRGRGDEENPSEIVVGKDLERAETSEEYEVKWIYTTIEDFERIENTHIRAATHGVDSETASQPSKSDRISEGLDVLDKFRKLHRKIEVCWYRQMIKMYVESLDHVETETQLNKWLMDFSIACKHNLTWKQELFNRPDELLQQHGELTGGFLKRTKGTFQGILYCYVPQLASTQLSLMELKNSLASTFDVWISQFSNEIEADLNKEDIAKDNHLLLRNILLSKHLYTGNLCNQAQLEQRMQQVARIDRLPDANDIEETKILCMAWDSVDLFTLHSRRFKRITKVSYGLQLLIAAAAIIITTLSINDPNIVDKTLRARLVIGLSLAGTAIASGAAYLDPAQRWTQLQGAAMGLESEIWKFRTRTGVYQLYSTGNVNHAESLRLTVESVRQHTSKTASISDTTFGSKMELFGDPPKNKLSQYKHGQYRGCGCQGTFGYTQLSAVDNCHDEGPNFLIDDHHSPLSPDKYLQLRAEPMVRFYQKRLPSYYRFRSLFQAIMVLGSLSGMLLAFLELDEWIAISTATASIFTAWSAFSGTEKKVSRYSNTIEKIQSILLWWKSLSPTDKALPGQVQQLVTACEDTFEREYESWAATSMDTQLLQLKSTEANATSSNSTTQHTQALVGPPQEL